MRCQTTLLAIVFFIELTFKLKYPSFTWKIERLGSFEADSLSAPLGMAGDGWGWLGVRCNGGDGSVMVSNGLAQSVTRVTPPGPAQQKYTRLRPIS